MPFELVADRGADEVGPVRIKAVANQQIDMTKVDEAEIDRDLLALGLWPQLLNDTHLPSSTIH